MRRLLIDGPWLTQREFKKLGHLSVKIGDGEVSTGIPFSFIRQISAIIRTYAIESVSIFWDTGFAWDENWPNFTKDMFSGLKNPNESEQQAMANSPLSKRLSALRDYRHESFSFGTHYFKSLNVLRNEFIPALGIQQYASAGWEAGDLLFSYCFEHKNDDIFILSGSPRFFYLLSPSVRLIESSDSNEMYTVQKFKADIGYDLNPNQVLDVLSLCGIGTDNIPPVVSVSYNEAAKFLLDKGGRLADILSLSIESFPSSFNMSPDWQDQLIRNRALVTHYYIRSLYGYVDLTAKYNSEAIDVLLKKYQFKSLIQKSEWKDYYEKLYKSYLMEAANLASSNLKSKLRV